MPAELATVSFRTESGVAENESWTLVGSCRFCRTLALVEDVPLVQGLEALFRDVLERDHGRPHGLRVAP